MKKKAYIIKKGEHKSGIFIKLFCKKKINTCVAVSFDKNCLETVEGIDALDINKLFGYSFGFRHHKNSFRIGWRSNGETIDLFAYYYIDGKREFQCIKKGVLIGSWYNISLTYMDDAFRISVVDTECSKVVSYIEYKIPRFLVGYKLFPYFGGNKPAPETMKIITERW